jgi:hypothetical protein
MQKDYLTLQDTAVMLGKSVQTVRRMIKRGDLKAQRIRTPQGFHYVVDREDLGIEVFSNSPIQNADRGLAEAEKTVPTNQNGIPTSQSEVEAHTEAASEAIDKKDGDVVEIEVTNEKIEKENVKTRKAETCTCECDELKAACQALSEQIQDLAVRADERKAEREAQRAKRKAEGQARREFLELKMKACLVTQHREKMSLLRVIERLQGEMESERRKPRSFFAYLIEWLFS